MRHRSKHILGVVLALVLSATSAWGATRWVDITAQYFTNPSFTTQDKSDWTFRGDASAFARISSGAIEMWQGWMEASRELTLPDGHYRFSMQGLFRFRRHVWAYPQWLEGTDERSAFIEVNDRRVEVLSEYTFHFDTETADCYKPEGEDKWFPNSMATAEMAFNAGAYPNELEVDVTNGKMSIFIYNEAEQQHSDNWLIFDQVKLERLEDVVEPAAGDVCVNEIVAANVDLQLSPAYNFDGWVELYNRTDKSLVMGGCVLSDHEGNRWRLPDDMGRLEPHGYMRIWLGSNALNPRQATFKLDSEGGTISLATAGGRQLLSQSYPAAISRTAYARTTDGGDTWSWTDTPTPGATNATAAYADVRTEAPTARSGQLFDDQLRVTVRHASGTTLRYTTDGTTPTLTNGAVSANGIFTISETTSFRFRCFAEGQLASPVVTRTYIKKDHPHTLPIIAVSTADEYLYDDMIGVYTRGINGRTGNGQSTPANWNMDWDRPVNFQLLLPESNTMALNQDVDFAISGGWTRAGWPKSFKLKADRVYEDQNTMPYAFFRAKPYIRNKTIQVRYGGNDTGSRIKDAALHEIIQRSGVDIDVMSYQPAVHYINGEYRGLINIREPNNKDFVYANWGLTKSEIEMYEQSPDSGAYMMIGRPDVLHRLYELSATASDAASYAEICDLVDIDEFTNYMAAELYLGSWDWPDNNLKAYRPVDGGRYRITFFDVDAAFGTDGRGMDEEGELQIGGNAFRWIDGMQWHRYDLIYDTNERRYGEIKFCTFFLNLLENDDFRRRFIDTFCTMGSVFEPTRAAAICDELGQRVRQTMSWEGASPDGSLGEIRSRLNGRAAALAKQMKAYERFRLSAVTPQTVSLSTNIDGGEIYVNGIRVPYAEYDGQLFPPVTLKAEARGGYRFLGWRYADDTQHYITGNAELPLPEGNGLHLVADFRKLTTRERRAGFPDVRINEVSAANDIYANDNYKRNDWIELYNTTDHDIDLAGLYLSDDPVDPHKYAITAEGTDASTMLEAGGRRIVWCDGKEGTTQLHATFKLAQEGGMVSITAADDSWSDILYYDAHDSKHTVGRYPDGADDVFVMNIPTIDKANMQSSYTVAVDQTATAIRPAEALGDGLTLRYAAGRLAIRTTTADEVDVAIYTADGRQVMTATPKLAAGYADVDCHALHPGAYVVRATDSEGRHATTKFIR